MKYRKIDLFWLIYKFAILLLFLQSLRMWFFWDLLIPIHLLAAMVSVVGVMVHKKYFFYGKYQLWACFFLAVFEVYFGLGGSVNGYIAILLKIIVVGSCICLKGKYKLDLFNFLLKAFTWVLIPSLVFWILFLLGVSKPFGEIAYNDNQYLYDNYLFFLRSKTLIFEDAIFPRFSSYFLEPGHLGMVTSFFIIASNFNFKNRFILIQLIITIFSFSLSAFLIIGITYGLKMALYSKRRFLNILLFVIVLVTGVVFFQNYNNGDNVFNRLVLERLMIKDGNIIGNNRTTLDFDVYFNQYFYKNMFFGLGNFFVNALEFEATAGVKVFLLTFGVFGLLLATLLYTYIYKCYPSKLGLILFVGYVLCFIQASYPLWECLLFIFIVGTLHLHYLKQKLES